MNLETFKARTLARKYGQLPDPGLHDELMATTHRIVAWTKWATLTKAREQKNQGN